MQEGITPKLKIVYLMKILYEKTDEIHAVTMSDILSELKNYGIEAERKSIYNDIEQLKLFGVDIIGEQRDRTYYYHVGNRTFELAELKLLVDSVASARFITEKKSNALIKKIESLASVHEARMLQRQVFVTERVKSENEQILYNIDAIHNAISQNSMISFKYFNWSVNKEMKLRHDGATYEMSPWALTLAEENYYLVCFDAASDTIKYFRVDKMLKIKLLERQREGRERFENFDIANYAKKRFRMNDGEEKIVSIRCRNDFAGVIIDRFGKDVPMHPIDADHFTVNVNVAVSNQFLAWVIAMSEGMVITGPDDVIDRAKKLIDMAGKQYR